MITASDRTNNSQIVYSALKSEIFSTLHCMAVGVVTAQNTSESSVTVKLTVSERTVNGAGKIKYVDFSPMSDVPFVGTTMPNVGDSVLIGFCDLDFASWWSSGSGTIYSGTPKSCNPESLAMHSINNAIVIGTIHEKGAYVAPGSNQSSPISAGTADNGMGISDSLIKFIESWEGFVSGPNASGAHGVDYWNTTIGYGHVMGDGNDSGISFPLTKATAETLLKSDLSKLYIAPVKKEFAGVTLKQNQFDCLVDLSYNLGPYCWSHTCPTFTADVKAGASAGKISQDLMNLCHCGGTVCTGLQRRREADAEMYNNGVYKNND